MKTYRVSPYGGGSYTVSINDRGVVDVDGLSPETAESLKLSVKRHMDRRGLPATTALGLVVGSYATVEVAANESVSDNV